MTSGPAPRSAIAAGRRWREGTGPGRGGTSRPDPAGTPSLPAARGGGSSEQEGAPSPGAREICRPPGLPAGGASWPVAAATAMDPFLTLLHSFSSSLSESELSDLKFLCQDKIGKRKLESVRSGRELFSLLLEQRAIASDNVGFLETMLRTIKREDLMVRLQQFVEGGEVNAAELPDANEKRLQKAAIEVICENVGRDWKMLMRSLAFPEVKIERIVTAHPFNLYEQLIQSLQEWQKWKGKDAKVADLIKGLRDCSMNLVADRVEQKLLQMNTENK